MLLIVPVLILWMHISREFEISMIVSRAFNIVEYHLQACAGMIFSDREQRICFCFFFKKKKEEEEEDRRVWRGRNGNNKKNRQAWETTVAQRIEIWWDFLWCLLLFLLTEVNGQQIKQIPQFLLLQEGGNFTTYCNSSRTLNTIQWYKQSPGRSPVLLMKLVKAREVKKQERLTALFGDTRKDSSLHITATQTEDVGTYFCAEAQCSQSTCCLSPTLLWGSGRSFSLSLFRAGVRASWSHNIYLKN